MHHSRKKSGHNSANTSMTDVRRAVTASDPSRFKRPTMSRRTTPATSQKLGKTPKDREREWQDPWDDERESFPQYCMTCEKQFIPKDDRCLYCSETCRQYDQGASEHDDSSRRGSSYSIHHNNYYASEYLEPRDIIPRASPSRPNSTSFSPPLTPSDMAGYHTSAVSALRSLTVRPPSPPSPTGSHAGMWPFSRSAATSPSTSYNRGGSAYFSSTYDVGYGATTSHAYHQGTNGVDRPLPTRNPHGYSRPKSIELVTPLLGR